MKAFYLVIGMVAAALLSACTTVVDRPVGYTYTTPSVAYTTPTYVAPPYVVVR
jgi:hypothetical protein